MDIRSCHHGLHLVVPSFLKVYYVVCDCGIMRFLVLVKVVKFLFVRFVSVKLNSEAEGDVSNSIFELPML